MDNCNTQSILILFEHIDLGWWAGKIGKREKQENKILENPNTGKIRKNQEKEKTGKFLLWKNSENVNIGKIRKIIFRKKLEHFICLRKTPINS